MSTLTIEHFAAPTSGRVLHRLDDAQRRAADGLADRTVHWWPAGEGHRDPVDPEDIVVLRERPTPELVEALRELGAHVLWHVAARLRLPAVAVAVDAYVMTWYHQPRPGRRDHDMAAFMPCPGTVVAKVLTAGVDDELGWRSLLADIVHNDRDETIGGTHHARPYVAAR
jgi:hypothetical protein